MHEYGDSGRCHDCGGSDGHHYNDCIYDGTSGGGSYSRHAPDTVRWIVLIIALIAGGLCPPIGALLFWIALKM